MSFKKAKQKFFLSMIFSKYKRYCVKCKSIQLVIPVDLFHPEKSENGIFGYCFEKLHKIHTDEYNLPLK